MGKVTTCSLQVPATSEGSARADLDLHDLVAGRSRVAYSRRLDEDQAVRRRPLHGTGQLQLAVRSTKLPERAAKGDAESRLEGRRRELGP